MSFDGAVLEQTIAGGDIMGFKDLPGGQNDKSGKNRTDLAGELSPQKKEPPKNK